MKLIIRDDKMLLAAAPTGTLMDIASGLEGRRKWGKNGLTMETTGHNIDLLRAHVQDLVIRDKRTPFQDTNLPPADWDLDRVKFKTKPYPHQRTALQRIGHNRSFALFMEQGTGKTKVILDWARILYNGDQIRAILIIAPKGVHVQWIEDQAEQHMSGYWVGGWWPNDLPSSPGHQGGKGALILYAMNYDALRTAKGKARAHEFIDRHGGKVLLVLDESHMVKNYRSKRWANCNDLRDRVEYCILATGTPIAKDLCDEWAQLKLLDETILGIRYVTHFRNEYCIMGGYQGRQVIGSRNIDRFKDRTAPYVYRVRKADIGIEPKQYSLFKFDMTAPQKVHYKRMVRETLIEIDEGAFNTVDNAAARIVKLQQISNGYIDYQEVNPDSRGRSTQRIELFKQPKDNPRVAALLECLEGMEEESVIIWCRFHYDVEQVSAALDHAGVSFAQYYGPTPDGERQENVKRFLKGEVRAFIATAATGGVGLNLQGLCTNAIYYSNSENSIQRWQSEDRIHRIGIKRPITYTDLVARGSRDLPILANLRRKRSLSDLTLGDLRKELEKIL